MLFALCVLRNKSVDSACLTTTPRHRGTKPKELICTSNVQQELHSHSQEPQYLVAEFARVCYITDADFQTAGIERRPRPWGSSLLWGVRGCRERSNLEPTGTGQGKAMSGVLGDLWTRGVWPTITWRLLSSSENLTCDASSSIDLWRYSVAEHQVKDYEVNLFDLMKGSS